MTAMSTRLAFRTAPRYAEREVPMSDPTPARRRGRPPKAPEARAPHRSGQHVRVEGDELLAQRRVVLDVALAAIPADGGRLLRRLAEDLAEVEPTAGALPRGTPERIAAVLGMAGTSGAAIVRHWWAGNRRYRPVVRIF